MPDPTRTLREALRDLPAPPPPADGWQRVQASLPGRRSRPDAPWLAAAALILCAGLGLALWPTAPSKSPLPDPSIAEPDAANSVAALRAESAQWERLLAELGTPVDSAATAAAQLAIGDRIALIDLLLGVTDAQARKALWSERVDLLRDLYRLRSDSSAQFAAHRDGIGYSGAVL